MYKIPALRYRGGCTALLASCALLAPTGAFAADNSSDIVYLRQNTFGAPSPFVGQSALSTMHSDGEEQQTITTGADRFQVSWSPNGKRVVYAKNRDIYTADPDGTNVQQLTTDGATFMNSEPDWSSDGTMIAFTRKCGVGRDRCVFAMKAADGSGMTQITQKRAGFEGTDTGPDWSSDDAKIAYAKVLRGASPGRDENIYTATVATNNEKLTISDSYSDVAPAWGVSGASERILFESDRPTNEGSPPNANVWRMNTDGSGLVPLTLNSAGYDGQPVSSPDGRYIAFVSDRFGKGKTYFSNNYADILVMNQDGSRPVQITNSPDLEVAPDWRFRSQVDPRFRILIERGSTGSRDIFSVSSDGMSGERRLTANPADDFAAVWSPDRSRIAFISNRDGKQLLYVMNADGSDIKPVGDQKLGSYDNPAWTADGREIVVSVEQGKQKDLFGVDASSGTVRRITNTPYSESCPDVSPDNKKIAFHSDQPSFQNDVYTVNVTDGKSETRLTTTPWSWFSRGAGECPRYSRDGLRIAFERRFARISEIVTVRASDGSDLRPVSPKVSGDGQRRPLWAPTTDYLAFTDGKHGSGDIIVTKPDGTDGKFVTDGLATSWR